MNAEEATRTGEPLKPYNDDEKIMTALIERYGLPVQSGSEPFAMLRTEFMRGYGDLCRKLLELDRSLDNFDFDGSEPLAALLNASKGMSLQALTHGRRAAGEAPSGSESPNSVVRSRCHWAGVQTPWLHVQLVRLVRCSNQFCDVSLCKGYDLIVPIPSNQEFSEGGHQGFFCTRPVCEFL